MNNTIEVKRINFGMVKKTYLNIIQNEETADLFHKFCKCWYDDNTEIEKTCSMYLTKEQADRMNEIYLQFENITFKESRNGGGYSVIGESNINSYLQYHSGIHYRWFQKINKLTIN